MEEQKEKKDDIEYCPHCGQFKLRPENLYPDVSNHIFEIVKKASIIANRNGKEDKNFDGFLITKADPLSIRDYFDGLKEMAEDALVKEDLKEIMEKIEQARLNFSSREMQRLFLHKREEALRYLEFMYKEFIRSEDEYAKRELKDGPAIKEKNSKLLSIIKELSKEGDAVVSVSIHEIMRACEAQGMKMGEVIRGIEWLKHEGDIFEPMRDRIQLI